MVNDLYEDDAGQSIINNLFGKNFSITGYISQSYLNSFIMMSPSDKLHFLEKFALEETDLCGKKIRCKKLIKEFKEELISNSSKLELSQDMLEKTMKPEVFDFPLKSKSKNKEKSIRNEEIREINTRKLIKKSNKKLLKLREEKNDKKILENFINNTKNDILKISVEIENFVEEKNNMKYIGDKELYLLHKKLNNIVSNREFLV